MSTDNFSDACILGGGGFGSVAVVGSSIEKRFYEKNCENARKEFQFQSLARSVLKSIGVHVPKPFKINENNVKAPRGDSGCGLIMERIYPPVGYKDLVHCALGQDYEGRMEVAGTSESRGYFARLDTINQIVEHTPLKDVDTIALKMGQAYRALIDASIGPFDLEFVLGRPSEAEMDPVLYVIDFGMCKDISHALLPKERANIVANNPGGDGGGMGLDIYIPIEGTALYEPFLKGLRGYSATIESLIDML